MMKRTNESGYTLISVLLVFLLFSVLGVSLTTMSLSSVKASKTEQNFQSSFYIAEAGLNYKFNKIKNALSETQLETTEHWDSFIDFHMNDNKYLSFDQEDELVESPTSDGLNTYAEIQVNHLPDVGEYVYEIVSIGHQDNQTRTVSQAFNFNYEEIDGGGEYELPPFAVFTSGDFEMNNGTIIGPIGTTNDAPGAINFPSGGPSFNGDIYVPNGDENIFHKGNNMNSVKATIKPLDPEWKVPELPEFPNIPNNYATLTDKVAYKNSNSTPVIDNGNLLVVNWITDNYELELNQNVYFKSIQLNENNTLYINTNNLNIEVVVDHLNLSNGHIKLIGDGSLTFYVTDKITMAAASTINDDGDISKVNIFLKGSEPAKSFSMAGDTKIFGSLYAENANISLDGSGNIDGNIFSGGKELTVSGGSKNQTQLFFAPNAEVKFSGGGTLNGRVIGNKVTNSGGAKIIFDNNLDNYITGPISIEVIKEFNKSGSGGSLPFPSGQINPESINIDKTGPFREIDHK